LTKAFSFDAVCVIEAIQLFASIKARLKAKYEGDQANVCEQFEQEHKSTQ
jgi:hypothetical protein